MLLWKCSQWKYIAKSNNAQFDVLFIYCHTVPIIVIVVLSFTNYFSPSTNHCMFIYSIRLCIQHKLKNFQHALGPEREWERFAHKHTHTYANNIKMYVMWPVWKKKDEWIRCDSTLIPCSYMGEVDEQLSGEHVVNSEFSALRSKITTNEIETSRRFSIEIFEISSLSLSPSLCLPTQPIETLFNVLFCMCHYFFLFLKRACANTIERKSGGK